MTCVNCGHPVVEAYCARCGQRRRQGRFSLGPLVREAADAAFNLDSGLLRTFVDLSRRPGAMARDYVAGRTRRYANPAKYLVICVAVTTFVSIASGFAAAPVDAAMAASPDAEQGLTHFFEFVLLYFNLILILGLPVLPLLTRLLFRRADFNLTEHLIFNTYVYAQQNLIFVALIPAYLVAGLTALTILYSVGITVYYVWACRGFFRLGAFSTVVRAAMVMVLFSVAFIVGMTAALLLVVGV